MNAEATRVVVTGLGVISPLGNTVAEFWAALVAGRSGVGTIRRFDPTPLTVSVAAEVTGFNPREHADARTVRTADPSAVYMLAACREAVAAAELVHPRRATSVGVVVGFDVAHESIRKAALGLERSGPIGVDSFALVQTIPISAGSLIAQTFGFRGPQYAVSGACASGALAVLQGANLIRLGHADAVVAGCAMTLNPLVLATCSAARVLSRNPDPATASRPFDRLRDGFVIGEGAAALVIEAFSHAVDRGAPILGEILGGSQTASVSGYTVNPASDVARCIELGLAAAAIDPSEVDLVGAHATGTPVGDRQEAAALNQVFAGRSVPAFAAKSMLGHCSTAGGGLETVALVLALRNGITPPTINYEHPDPLCKVDCVPNKARHIAARIAVKNSFGFGGVNSCLVLRRWDQ